MLTEQSIITVRYNPNSRKYRYVFKHGTTVLCTGLKDIYSLLREYCHEIGYKDRQLKSYGHMLSVIGEHIQASCTVYFSGLVKILTRTTRVSDTLDKIDTFMPLHRSWIDNSKVSLKPSTDLHIPRSRTIDTIRTIKRLQRSLARSEDLQEKGQYLKSNWGDSLKVVDSNGNSVNL